MLFLASEKRLLAIAKDVTVIISTSLVTSNSPPLWKHAFRTSVSKSGDSEKVHNYRCITKISILFDIFDKFLADHITAFLASSNLLIEAYHGFKLFTETRLL